MSLLTSAIKTDLYRFFSIAFNAAPGVTYMNQLATAVESGMTVKQIVNVFTAKTEFTSTYPSFYTADQFANKLVETVVGTSATDAAKTSAKADIVAALNAGWSRGDVVYQIFNNLANKASTDATWGTTSTQMANKVAVAQYYTEDLLTDTTTLSTLRAVIANVTATTDVSTAAAKQAVIDVAVPVDAQSFTLTTSSDVKTLGAGADTFYGSLTTAGTTDTLTAGDNLNGAGGVDTLSISITGTGSTTSANPTLTNVEKVLVSNAMTVSAGAGTGTIDMSLADSSVTNVGTTASSTAGATTLFSNVGNIVAAEMRGLGNLTVNYVSSIATGTADAMTVTLNGVGASGANGTFDTNNKIEKLTLASSSSSTNYVTLGAGANDATGITVTGSSALTLDLGSTALAKSINASAATAAVTVTNIDNTNTTITGGSGNDSFTFNATMFDASTGTTAKDVVDGGAGTDTLVLNQGTGFADTIFGNVTNVETLTLSGTGAVTVSTVAKAAGITTVNMGAGSGSLTVGTGYSGNLTVGLSTGSDDTVAVSSTASGATLTVKGVVGAFSSADHLTGSAATGDVDTLSLTADNATGVFSAVTGFETITIAANTTSGSYGATLNNLSVASGKTLTIDASALTNTGAAVVIDGSTGAGGFSITGGAGSDTITLGSGGGTVNAGAGNDTIVGGAGNDVLNGGDGNDSITAGAGNDSINGGAGNDTIVFASTGQLSSGDTIDGGDGTGDTIVLANNDTITSSMFTNVTNVEKLQFVGSATLTGNIPFTTFDLSNATGQTLVLGTGYTSATTVTLGDAKVTSTGATHTVVATADSVTSQGSAALTINASVAALVDSMGQSSGSGSSGYDAAATIAGGSGTDTLNLTASFDGKAANTYASSSGGTLVLGTGTNITGLNVITIVDGGDGTGAGNDVYLTLNAGALGAIKVDASALDDGTGTTNEQLVFDGSLATGNLTIIGGAATDSITGGSGFDNIDGGAGNDVITMGNFFNFNDTITGGDGTADKLVIEQGAGGLGDLAFLNVTSIEKLGVGTGAGTVTLDTRAQAAGITSVVFDAATTGAVAVTAQGFTNAVTFDATAITAGTGTLKLTGGTANDVFAFAATGLTTDESLIGGAGTDTIRLDNGATAAGTGAGVPVVAVLGTGITGVESILVNDLGTGTTGTVSITLDTNFGNTGESTVSVDASSLDASETLTFINNSTGYTSGSSTVYPTVNVTGGVANDTITGGKGADTISGGSGADSITGGVGADSLTGGAGNDVFVYATGDSTSVVTDTITDFTLGSDTIKAQFVLSGNGATGSYGTYVGSTASNADGLSLLSGKVGEYFYNTTNSQLVMDTDGNGLIQSTDTIITLTSSTGLSNAAVLLDITGSTGADNITGSAAADLISGGSGADTISGGSGADSITGGAGADSLTGGAGADSFVYAAVADSAASIAANTTVSFDVITDFTSASDKINLAAINATLAGGTAATSITVTTLTTGVSSLNSTSIATFADLKTAADSLLAASTSSGLKAYFVDLTGNTGALGTGKYLLINDGTAALTATDVMIQLTGTSTTPVAGDFTLA